MKKITLFFAALFVAMTAFAEIQIDSLWQVKSAKSGDDVYKFTRGGIEYLDGELLLANRDAAKEVVFLNSETGEVNATALKDSPHAIGWQQADIDVDANGAIYLSNASSKEIYKYANKTAEPVLFATLPTDAGKVYSIDVLVDAEGNGCLVGVDNTAATVYYSEITANVAGEFKKITIKHKGGIAPRVNVVTTKSFWIDANDILPTLITLNGDFTVASEKAIVSDEIAASAIGVTQFEFKGKTYLVCGGNNHNTSFDPKHCGAVFELNPADLTVTRVGGALPTKGLGESKDGNVDEAAVYVTEDAAYIYFMGGACGVNAFKMHDVVAPTIPTSFATFQEALDFLTRPEVTDDELAATYAVEEPAVVSLVFSLFFDPSTIYLALQVKGEAGDANYAAIAGETVPAFLDSIQAKVSFDGSNLVISEFTKKGTGYLNYTECTLDDLYNTPENYDNMPVILKDVLFDTGNGCFGDGNDYEASSISYAPMVDTDYSAMELKNVNAKGVFFMQSTLIYSELELASSGSATAVENAELSSNVYSSNGTLFVEAEAGDMINVYTLDGRNIYSAVAASSLNAINVKADMVIVRVNNEVHKAVIK